MFLAFLLKILILLWNVALQSSTSEGSSTKMHFIHKFQEEVEQEKLSDCYASCLPFYRYCDDSINSNWTGAFYKCERIVNITVTETYCYENGNCDDCGACTVIDKFWEIQDRLQKDDLALQISGDLLSFCNEKYKCLSNNTATGLQDGESFIATSLKKNERKKVSKFM